MTELGMPTLIELPEPEDCARLCRELGLQFVELILFLERKSIKKNFTFALQCIAIPGFPHGDEFALLIKE